MLRRLLPGPVAREPPLRCIGCAVMMMASCAALSTPPSRSTGSNAAAVASGHQWLDRARKSRSGTPWSAGISASLRLATSGQVFEGRGGMAVAPERAVRLILLMAGGPTLLDVWVTPERWRVAVPARGTVERGSGAARAGLPVSFLQRRFLNPFEGALIEASASETDLVMVVRDRDAMLEIRAGRCDGGDLTRTATRVRGLLVDQFDECLAPEGPRPGNWAHYRDVATGLTADVKFESVSVGTLDDAAFVDPDGVGLTP